MGFWKIYWHKLRHGFDKKTKIFYNSLSSIGNPTIKKGKSGDSGKSDIL